MLPLYVVIETSGELGTHLAAINDGLDALVRSLQTGLLRLWFPSDL